MTINPDTLSRTVASELGQLKDSEVSDFFRSLLVVPTLRMRRWDYGPPDTVLPCWVVLSDPASDTEIGYCEEGFGPRNPWGLLNSDIACGMGMDSAWFPSFTDALFDSFAVTQLPIWCVAKNAYSSNPSVLTDRMSWEAAWEMVFALRREQDDPSYGCIDCGVC